MHPRPIAETSSPSRTSLRFSIPRGEFMSSRSRETGPPRLRAGEGARVLDRLERRDLRVRVGADGAGLRVGDRHDDVDVGQTSRKDPETRVEGPTVHDLDHHLNAEERGEPEVPGAG